METAAASSADDGRPQYLIRNSDSSATSGDNSSDDSSFDSSFDSSGAGDSPQGKSDAVQSHQDARRRLLPHPPAAVSHRTREAHRERERYKQIGRGE